jgi:hypothetical protein
MCPRASKSAASECYARGVGGGDVVVIELNRQAMEQPAGEARFACRPRSSKT